MVYWGVYNIHMRPKQFLVGGGAILIVIGILGVVGLFGLISQASFFHPPHWINWFHLFFGIFVLTVGLKGVPRLQRNLTLGGAIVGTTIGLLGLLFGSYVATRFALPELADPSDHIAHLIVGVCAIWAWRNRVLP